MAQNTTLPIAVCAVVNEILTGSHQSLDALFKAAGAPGDPPSLSHASKWKTWLQRASQDPNTDAHSVLGKIIEEFMEVEPPDDQHLTEWLGTYFPSAQELWRAKKERLESTLARNGLRYMRGGRIAPIATGPATTNMREVLAQKDMDAVGNEFQRTTSYLPNDPAAAITGACALLEALFKAYIELKQLNMPSKQTVKPLWTLVQHDLGLDPKDQTDADIQRVLSGLTGIVDGIAALRTHAGSAHGGGRLRYKVQERHARLAVNSAHTIAAFIIETWKSREI